MDTNLFQKKSLYKRDLTEVTGEVIAFISEHFNNKADVIVIDETGLGSGVVDNLREAQSKGVIHRNTEIRGVQFGASCESESDREKFVNIKARMFGLLADDIKREDGLTLPEEDIYLEELPSILYTYDSKGRLVIESKDAYKKRTGRSSPDVADSLALANFGRYDESSLGTFDRDDEIRRPLAQSLGGSRVW